MKERRNLVSLLLAIALTLVQLTGDVRMVRAAGVEVCRGMPATVMIGPDGTSTTHTVVGFGGSKWDVIGYNGSGVASSDRTLTLLAKASFDLSKFHNTLQNQYSNSDLHKAVNAAADSMDTKERALIIPRTLAGGGSPYGEEGYDDNKIAGTTVAGALFWPLSTCEAYAGNMADIRSFSSYWWLRSPGYFSSQAAFVRDSGIVIAGGANTTTIYGVRPAFNLNLASVVLTSAAEGGKAAVVGGALSKTEQPAGAVKFTMADSEQTLNITATTVQKTQPAAAFEFAYKNATTGLRQFISCVLADSSGTVRYYGKLKDLSMPYHASGTFSIPFSGVEAGTYILTVFDEVINADNYTDFCSAPITMALTVNSEGMGTISDYGDIPPAVISLTPGGSGVDITTGALSITFNDQMDPAAGGTVTIKGATVSGPPVWGNHDQTVTYDLSGLSYGTVYTVIVSGFANPAGGVMEISEHTFITAPQPGTPGREIELRAGATHIQWRYLGEGDGSWRDIISLEAITGERGETGPGGLRGAAGSTGAAGETGMTGGGGVKGKDGASGNGIVGIEKTGMEGNVDTYTIFFTNGEKMIFTVSNGKDGAGIATAAFNESGELILTLTDGATVSAGVPSPRDNTIPIALGGGALLSAQLWWLIPLLRRRRILS